MNHEPISKDRFYFLFSNVLYRLGELARPTLPAVKLSFETVVKSQGKRDMGESYLVNLLIHTIAVLEGLTRALNYPTVGISSSSN